MEFDQYLYVSIFLDAAVIVYLFVEYRLNRRFEKEVLEALLETNKRLEIVIENMEFKGGNNASLAPIDDDDIDWLR